MIIGYLTVNNGWPLWAALVAALAAAIVVGTINGLLVRENQITFLHHHSCDAVHCAWLRARRILRMLVGTSRLDGVRDAAAADPLAVLFSTSVKAVLDLFWSGGSLSRCWRRGFSRRQRLAIGSSLPAENQGAAVRMGSRQ